MMVEENTFPAPNKAKILLVDDRKENLYALESLLENDHVEIFKVSSGRDALELVLKHHFAIALLDVQMPEINGFELAELIRGSDRGKEIPIIFVTAGAIDPKHTFRGYEAGAVDFLYKPLDSRIVKSKVDIFLRLEEQRLKIEEQMKQLQSALKMREQFLSIASHELKTPLTSLSLQFQVAKRGIDLEKGIFPTPEKLVKIFDLGDRQISKLSNLIDELLDISRIREGKLIIRKKDTVLAKVVHEVVERFEEQLSRVGCILSLDLDENLIVPCESFRVEQVLVNLISNAIRYSPGAPIHVILKEKDGQAMLSVKDGGAGIAPEKLALIFEPFEQISAPSRVGGLGLGLYIVRQIMHAHGGEISVSSVEGQGCTFTAEFPLSH